MSSKELNRPTLVISPQQNTGRATFTRSSSNSSRVNAFEYFVSYFDYYQPEAYIPRSDTYIEKDSSINEEN